MDKLTLYHGDCLKVMKDIGSVDAVITDPPYGVTSHTDDTAVDLSVFINSFGVVCFSQQPYTSVLVSKFIDQFRYELIWDKGLTSGFLNANKMPLRKHENILVFGDMPYNPQKTQGRMNHSKGGKQSKTNNNYGKFSPEDNRYELGTQKHPTSIIDFDKPHPSVAKHRTEKPVSLMKWLILTYSNPGDAILDPFMGSGTTGVACAELGRKFIGIEIDKDYFEIAQKRIETAYSQEIMF